MREVIYYVFRALCMTYPGRAVSWRQAEKLGFCNM